MMLFRPLRPLHRYWNMSFLNPFKSKSDQNNDQQSAEANISAEKSKPEASAQNNYSQSDACSSPQLDPSQIEQLQNQFYSQIFHTPLNSQLLSNNMKLELDQLASQLLKNDDFRSKATPRMPAVLPQLMKCLKDENANKNQFVELIKQDAAIAAAVLKSANSVLYNPSGRKVDSFNRAVVILGVGGLKSIVCTAMLQPVSQSKAGNEELTKQLWAHSLRTGITAQLISKQYDQDPFIAYLVGLFHSIGALTVNTQLNLWSFENIREEANSFMYAKQLCGNELSLAIIKQWELPADIQESMANEMLNDSFHLLEHASAISHTIFLHDQEKLSEDELEEKLEELGINASFTEQVSKLTNETLNAQA